MYLDHPRGVVTRRCKERVSVGTGWGFDTREGEMQGGALSEVGQARAGKEREVHYRERAEIEQRGSRKAREGRGTVLKRNRY